MIALLALILPAFAGWQDDAMGAYAACATTPNEACDVVAGLQIRESRAGLWFVQDERLDVPHLQVLLGRMLTTDEPALRQALATGVAQLLTDADPTWHGAWADLAAQHPDALVRSTFISSLRRAPMSAAGPGLRGALAHAEPSTRRDAASIMGRQAEAATFVDDLIPALRDADPIVRQTAARALGHAGDPRALEALRAAKTQDDALTPEVDRALERLGDPR
jgi:HEAT repeat protein